MQGHNGCNEFQEASIRKPWAMLLLEKRCPGVWYGNVQHVAGLMVFFVALPGQSFFFGTLTPHLTKELGISKEIVSLYFFLAFGSAAIWLQFVGRLIDKHGTRRLVMAAIVPFVCAIWGISTSWNPWLSGFCYVMLRITGQETIAFAMTIAVNRWFVKKRARAASSLALAIGAQMQITAGITFLMTAIGWRFTVAGAGCITLGVTCAALPLLCDTPEQVGLGPDGAMSKQLPPSPSADTLEDSRAKECEVDFTRQQAMCTVQFWYMIAMGAAIGLSWGGINVHLWAYCQDKMLSSSTPGIIYVFIGLGVPSGAVFMGTCSQCLECSVVLSSALVYSRWSL